MAWIKRHLIAFAAIAVLARGFATSESSLRRAIFRLRATSAPPQ